VRGYLKEYPVARDLVLLVKAYMRRHKVNEVFLGGLGSYATFCLVISFLQVCSAMIGKGLPLGVLLTPCLHPVESRVDTTQSD